MCYPSIKLDIAPAFFIFLKLVYIKQHCAGREETVLPFLGGNLGFCLLVALETKA